jgi:hypothetical protein
MTFPAGMSSSVPPAPSAVLNRLQELTTSELLTYLLRFELAIPLLMALHERELTGSLEANSTAGGSETTISKELSSYCAHHRLQDQDRLHHWCFSHGMNSATLEVEAQHLQRRTEIQHSLLSESEESLFLRHKDRLDRVLYGLIRVESEALARDLFFAIDAGEMRFGEAAHRHSCGPEAQTEGIVGPVDLTTPHPEISNRLRNAAPGELIPPFKLEQWFAILRLDYCYSSNLDEDTRFFLRELSFRSIVRQSAEADLTMLSHWLGARKSKQAE